MIRMNEPNVFVTAMWRSGSMHIAEGLADALGWRQYCTASLDARGDEEQNVSPLLGSVLLTYGRHVYHQHTPATGRNLVMLEGFNVRPVVVVRDLLDSVVSLKERIDFVLPMGGGIPGMHIPATWPQWAEGRKWDWVVYNAVPWQLKFLASWKAAKIPALWVWYEEFYADQRAGFGKILDWYGLQIPDERLAPVIERKVNFNVGLVGRGKALVPSYLRQVIGRNVEAWGDSLPRAVIERNG